MIDRLVRMLSPFGLFVRGGFHPETSDGVPRMPDGAEAATCILVGNAGAAMWQAFRESAVPETAHPLDNWLRPGIEAAASACGAAALFPNDGPPFLPIDRWAMRAEAVRRSPIGILIHPDFGLWHVYRAVLLFQERLPLPEPDRRESPCAVCAKKPCLSVCPTDAFRPDRFDAAACVAHVKSADGSNCRERGCLARRACPVGRAYRYPSDQQAFHMDAMVRAVERGFGSAASQPPCERT
jgi:ferredoxin